MRDSPTGPANVRRIWLSIPGVTSVEIHPESSTATCRGTLAVDAGAIRGAFTHPYRVWCRSATFGLIEVR